MENNSLLSVHRELPEVYIVDGQRTPFLKATGRPGPFSAADLAVVAARDMLLRRQLDPVIIDELVLGCVAPREDEANIARLVALRLGCSNAMPAYTVQRNCGSGMQAIDSAVKDIQLGRASLILAGGTEAMSRAPLIVNARMTEWLADFMRAKKPWHKLALLTTVRPSFFKPIISLMAGLTDPIVEMMMGKTAELLAYEWGINREMMDVYALQSHQRASEHTNTLFECSNLYDTKGQVYFTDTGVRATSTIEELGRLKPFFDRPYGQVTAANSAQVTDGAAVLLLASAAAVMQYQLPVLGRVIDTAWAGVEPQRMGLGPAYAVSKLLHQQQLALADIDYWEINEAFAVQVLSCLAALNNTEFCQKKLGRDRALGEIDVNALNSDGGAIALGHPVGASGARIVLKVLEVMKRKKAKRGVAALCIGGGQGGAMLLAAPS